MSDRSAADAQTSLWRQPSGIFLVAGTEMWERFSYYGLVALLVLFLTAPTNAGGFGLAETDALQIFGLFAGFAFAMPVLGGWLADRFLGDRRAVLLGGVGILVGNLALFAAGGGFVAWQDASARFTLLCAGLVLIVLGTGLLKPAISALIGRIYDERPGLSRRAGYTLFMMGIWIGSVGGTLFAGVAGEAIGWRWGFLISVLGMAIGLGAYVMLAQRLLGAIGSAPVRRETATHLEAEAGGGGKGRPLLLIGVMSLFTAVYAAAFYQKAGTLNLFVRDATDRSLGGIELPASLFLTVSTAGFILFAPFIEGAFARLERRGIRIDVFTKQIGALLMLAIGYIFFIIAAWQSGASADGLHSPLWIILGYLCFAVGDVLIWPPQISAISAMAPRHMTGILIGGWYVTVGIGNILAGFAGGAATVMGRVDYFMIIQVGLVVAALLLALLRFGPGSATFGTAEGAAERA
jgi:POT family proton-dependent oligopeptide transporter